MRRAVLAVGGGDRARIEKAVASKADEVFCDLEDAVAPNEKARARHCVALALQQLDWGEKVRAVRINGLASPWWQEDIDTLLKEAGNDLDSIIVPKVGCAQEVIKIDKALRVLERKLKRTTPIGLELLIETLEGVENISAITKASKRIEALIFGAGDFAASMGMKLELPHQGDLLYYPRFKLVAAARVAAARAAARAATAAVGTLDVIDSPFFDFKDNQGLKKACTHAAAMGFDGKMAIHPAQLETCIKVFTPSKKEIERAQKIVQAYKEAQKQGTGAIAVDGEMIDVATARLYQNVLDKAKAIEA